MDYGSIKYHPVCRIVPAMTPEEQDRLTEAIRRDGRLRVPIVMHKGMLVDGRHRLAGCVLAGVEPRFEEWDGIGSLAEFVKAQNLERRHLTVSQLSTTAANLAEAKEKEDQERAAELSANGRNTPEPRPVGRPRSRRNKEAAEEVGVSERNVERARHVKKNAPDLFEEVHEGKLTLHAAEQQIVVAAAPPVDPIEAKRKVALDLLAAFERAAYECEESGDNIDLQKLQQGAAKCRAAFGERKAVWQPGECELPPELDTEEFRTKWREWCKYRGDPKPLGKGKKVTRLAAKKQLKELAAAGIASSIEAIDKAIASDWQSLQPKAATSGKPPRDKLAGLKAATHKRGTEVSPGVELIIKGEDAGHARHRETF